MIAFARTCAAIAATPSKLEKIALVAAYLRSLGDEDLAPATRYFTGNPFPQAHERRLAVGGRTIIEAAQAVWGVDEPSLHAAYRATGDLGAALGSCARPGHDLGLFRDVLTPASLYALLNEIADTSGKRAQMRRRFLCERILRAVTDVEEATYVVKIVTGELRIGLREGLVVDAVAQAFDRELHDVRRAASAAGDLGAVALAAKHNTLDHLSIAYHAPIAFMLASPIVYGSAYKELAGAAWLTDDKYDGVRIQAHVTPDRVSLFSRTLNDAAASYPEVVDALRRLPGSFAVDGEIVAVRGDAVLPFRFLQARLQRKDVSPAVLDEVPVRYIAFDALAVDDEILLDAPLSDRRARLTELLAQAGEAVRIAPWTMLEPDAAVDVIHQHFEDARARGNEGLVFKRPDSSYMPGRRGKAWLKLKRELATLDCVVVAVERGHGRRVQVLSDYTFAVRDGEQLAVIGKAYSGLTDKELAEMTVWFERHRLRDPEAAAAYARLKLRRSEVLVEPTVVIEVAFDVLQRSDLHGSGFALRFPRIVRLRPDKLPRDADTLQRVRAIYGDMLTREGVTD